MTVGNTDVTLDLIVAIAWGASLDNLVSAIMKDEQGPKRINCYVLHVVELAIEIEVHGVRSTRHRSDGVDWIASFDMRPVAVEFGKGLLEDWTPDRFIFTSVSELGVSILQGKVVVDEDGERHSKSIDVHSIDT